MKTRRRGRAGYTLIEVMLSVSVLVVGATGFTLLQGTSARAIQDAQEHTAALQLLETWVARVRRDASLWTTAGITSMSTTTLLNAGMATPALWFTPTTLMENGSAVSPGADSWGWDQVTASERRFCVKLRYQAAHFVNNQVDAVRADIVVWRPRRSAPTAAAFIAAGGTNCTMAVNFGSPDIFKAASSVLVRWQ